VYLQRKLSEEWGTWIVERRNVNLVAKRDEFAADQPDSFNRPP
jgi:hypothetical protein